MAVRIAVLSCLLCVAAALQAQVEQTAFGVEHRRNPDCDCLSWKDVHAARNVTCMRNAGLTKHQFEEVCTAFYHKIDDNFCTSFHLEQWSLTSWCYVSSKCQSLNGGEQEPAPNSGTSWKMCKW